ncbi:MAG: TonB-dependent receptor [Gemmatimonadaceae bacterium]
MRASTDSAGLATLLLPTGPAIVVAHRIGYAPDSARLVLASGVDTTVTLLLLERATVISPLIVSSTRTERRIEEEPLRVEILSGEDVGEKAQMHPADIRSLLAEMPGVRVQSTSPSLGGATLRILGLRGRYTQILTDGLPLYGAQAGSFGLLQIPPLDLAQAEIIKGAASALYGANAMGGVLDLITRRSPDSSEAIVNGTARGGADLAVFGAHALAHDAGVTLSAGAHTQRAVDVARDGWADVPATRRIDVRPRLFFSDSAGRSAMLTAGVFAEDRGGGSMASTTLTRAFPESLATRHADAGASARMRLTRVLSLDLRAAANVQSRLRRFGTQREQERSSTVFGEFTGTYVAQSQTLLVGLAAQHERYTNAQASRFDESRSTPAIFVQHTFTPSGAALHWLATQFNGRCDMSSHYGTICTPRVALLARAGAAFSARVSAAGGWNAPTALTEETELLGLSRVEGPLAVGAERARTASLDVTTTHGPLEVSGTLFASRVADPVGLRRLSLADGPERLALVNAPGPAFAHGGELFAFYHAEPIMVTAFYTATRTRETSPESQRLRESPYVPRETAGIDVAFDDDESDGRVGLELFYTGPQAVEENPYRAVAPAYATIGLLASKRFGRAMVYLNLENLTDVRQTKYDPLLRPSPGEGGRLTVDEWAPLEGRALNVGVRVQR